MKKILKKKKRKGFTLIELMIVIAILGILIAMLVPSITNYRNAANQIAAEAALANIETAIIAFEYTENRTINTNSANDDLGGYLDGDVQFAATAGNNTWGIEFVENAGGNGEYVLTAPTNINVEIDPADLRIDSDFATATTP